MTGHPRRLPWIVALTAAFLVPGVLPAVAHTHPTPLERAAPGVVYVEARAQVQVALVEHLQADPHGVHIAIIPSTSNPVLASASGFVVDPTGTIVTTGAITQIDVDRAKIYAVNEAFRKQYGAAAPLPGDLFTRQRVSDPLLEERLEACYPPLRTNDAGGCVVTVSPTYVVYPYVTDQKKYGQLDAELIPASTKDVAVLRVRGVTNMPTVALGDSTNGAKAVSVLGFTGIPTGPSPLRSSDAHLDKVGGRALKTQGLTPAETKEAASLAQGLTAGMRGGPVVAEQGEVIGFLAPGPGYGRPPAAAGRLVDVAAIRTVLSKQGISPRRGPVDSSFEAAMHAFKNGGFAAAVPDFKAALSYFPGHAVAAANLLVAQRKVAAGATGAAPMGGHPAGTDASMSASSFPWILVLVIAGAVLLLAVVGALILRRRRRASPGDAGSPSPVAPRPREGQPGGPARPAGVGRERQPVPSGGPAPGLGSGAVAVAAASGPNPGGAASPTRAGPAPSGPAMSPSAPGHGAAAAGAGPGRASRATIAPSPAPSSRRPSSFEASTGDRPEFCTTCGAHLAPHHRFCGRCGAAAG